MFKLQYRVKKRSPKRNMIYLFSCICCPIYMLFCGIYDIYSNGCNLRMILASMLVLLLIKFRLFSSYGEIYILNCIICICHKNISSLYQQKRRYKKQIEQIKDKMIICLFTCLPCLNRILGIYLIYL